MSLPPTSSTDRPDRPDPYYSYRVTLPHVHSSTITTLLAKYSSEWAGTLHSGDKETPNEHFHFIMMDFDQKKVDAFKKIMVKTFSDKGNGFHAGKFMTNDPVLALGYFKHDEGADFIHSDHTYWDSMFSASVPFIKGLKAGPKESLSYPVLTYSNVLKQALKYRSAHALETTCLVTVLTRMVSLDKWQPSRELDAKGVPLTLHQMFRDRCLRTPDTPLCTYKWMHPHVPSEDATRFGTQVYHGPIHDPGLIQTSI